MYDRNEAARQLSISVRELNSILSGNELDTRRIGSKVLITHDSLVRFASDKGTWHIRCRRAAAPLRVLNGKEYDKLCKAIETLFPEDLAEFIISVNTGMRAGEQYSLTWGQVDLNHKTIDLTMKRHDSDRVVHLNADALAAFESLSKHNHEATDPSTLSGLPMTQLLIPKSTPRLSSAMPVIRNCQVQVPASGMLSTP